MSSLLKNLALSLASISLMLLVVDLVLSPWLLPRVPLKFHAAIPRGVRMLTQSSKAAAVPRDWIAILGDSYAQGRGDWLLEVDPNRNPPFHSAHLLRERSGRDVMSFGASGAGSLRALVTEPIAGLDLLAQTLLFRTRDPDLFLFYFYEGNDLSDNVRDIAARFDPHFARGGLRDPVVFRRFIEEIVIADSDLGRDVRSFDWWDNFFFTRAVARGVGAVILGRWPAGFDPIDWSPQETNRAWIAGHLQPIPDGLQGPALELDEEQLELGLFVMESAFARFRERFHEVPLLVVYIPSPLTTYRIASDRVSAQRELGQGIAVWDRARLVSRGERICRRVAAVARAHGAGFVDARSTLWPLAERSVVHGPVDWKHLNRAGQEALVEAILPRILEDRLTEAETCPSLAQHFANGVPTEQRRSLRPAQRST